MLCGACERAEAATRPPRSARLAGEPSAPAAMPSTAQQERAAPRVDAVDLYIPAGPGHRLHLPVGWEHIAFCGDFQCYRAA